VPSIQQANGRGTRRLYALDDLVQLQFIHQLKHHGCSTQKIHAAITTLRTVMDDTDPLKSAVLVYSKTTLLALCKTKAGERILLDALSTGRQQVMGIVLESLEEETRHLAAHLANGVLTLA
jgi:DNA-binding transcriptional MerR regulator